MREKKKESKARLRETEGGKEAYWKSGCRNVPFLLQYAPFLLGWYRGLGLEVADAQKNANLIRDNSCPCQNT